MSISKEIKAAGLISVPVLLEAAEGPVTVFLDGEEKQFSSGTACLEALDGEYEVETIHEVKLVLRKVDHAENWMQIGQEKVGKDVSFF